MVRTEYLVLSAERSDLLENEVQKYLAAGWQLCGGVTVCAIEARHADSFTWAQAVTRTQWESDMPPMGVAIRG